MMRVLLPACLVAVCCAVPVPAADAAGAVDAFVAAAGKQGDLARRAAEFLVENMPEKDKTTLPAGYLEENLKLAIEARERFAWSRQVPDELFLNDVLPYASLDETREPWRRQFLELAAPMVAGCQSASEAAQSLNRGFFNKIGVHYSTRRARPNQSPFESMAQGKASCTGLAIILVNACRSVGIPARVVGTPAWKGKPGNHTWVEIWDNGWHFTGADEYDAAGLSRAWFTADAAAADGSKPEHAIYASSWKKTDRHFPLVWKPDDRSVPAVDVTPRYAAAGEKKQAGGVKMARGVHVRVWERADGERMAVAVELRGACGEILAKGRTKAGTADMNDMLELGTSAVGELWLRAISGRGAREWPLGELGPGTMLKDLVWDEGSEVTAAITAVENWLSRAPAERGPAPDAGLSKAEAARVRRLLWADTKARLALEMRAEVASKEVVAGDKRMKWLERTFGDAPAGGHSLWISLHGGGGAPPDVNDAQWQNQIRLYEPREGIVVAPRAPGDTWDLWHQGHVDALFDRLIAGMVACRGVDPDKVYLLGYSAGGDGVYQIAPRMADRWAAAAMMAGHPNESRPLGLRNLPFFVFSGKEDTAYNRAAVSADWVRQLDELRAADPGGYPHASRIFDGLGHWMNGKDAVAIQWMQECRRRAWPDKVVWLQDDVTHTRFYWLGLPPGSARKDQMIRAGVSGQTISLDAADTPLVRLRLADELLDLDQPVKVMAGDAVLFEGRVKRMIAAMMESLGERADPGGMASAVLEVRLSR